MDSLDYLIITAINIAILSHKPVISHALVAVETMHILARPSPHIDTLCWWLDDRT